MEGLIGLIIAVVITVLFGLALFGQLGLVPAAWAWGLLGLGFLTMCLQG